MQNNIVKFLISICEKGMKNSKKGKKHIYTLEQCLIVVVLPILRL